MADVTLEVLSDDRALAPLHEDWNRLLAETPLASGYQSFSWLAACRSVLAPRRALFTLVVRDGSDVVAIMPTELGRSGDLRFIGEAVSNYLGPLYRPERLDDVLTAFAAFLDREHRVRLIDLSGLREGSPFLVGLRELALPGWSPTDLVVTSTCPYVDLSGGFVSKRLQKSRSKFRRKWAALEKLGRLEFRQLVEPDEVRGALPTMFALFEERWAGRHESGGFAGRYRSFHEYSAPALAAAGLLRLSVLELDGRIVAFSYSVCADGVTTGFVLAHDNRLNVCSPGSLLLVGLLEAACERGDAECDFGPGHEAYKTPWASGVRRLYRLLRWRRASVAAATARVRGFKNRMWVRARSVEWLRSLKREGPRRFLLGAPGLEARPDAPGLPAGEGDEWTVYRVSPPDGAGPEPSVRPLRYGEMVEALSPRLLELAVDRGFRGDTLLAVFEQDVLRGVVWRAGPSRAAAVTGGLDAGAVYYHPVPDTEPDLTRLLRAFGSSIVLTTRAGRADGVAERLGSFRSGPHFKDDLVAA